ncbi:unnamed protein product [Fusarium graminearum]|nr:unnamed protein product [Fusarium graminearum]CZS85496.1 unnamed protein product [Fusarium graminearum]
MVAAMKLFLVWPATLDMPIVMMRLTVPPKNPVMEYPTTGAAARYDHSLFQMMAQPAITARQENDDETQSAEGKLEENGVKSAPAKRRHDERPETTNCAVDGVC